MSTWKDLSMDHEKQQQKTAMHHFTYVKWTIIFSVRAFGASYRKNTLSFSTTVNASWYLVFFETTEDEMLKQSGSNTTPLWWSMTCCIKKAYQKISLSLWEDDIDRETKCTIKKRHLIYFKHWKSLCYMTVISAQILMQKIITLM